MGKISDLATAIERHEPMNAPLFLRAAQPLARLAGRHAGVLQLTMGMVDKARRIEPQKAEYAAEYAYQQMMLGNLDGAAQTLRMAGTLEEGSPEVMAHQILCQVLQGQNEDAELQLEFLGEMQGTSEKTPEVPPRPPGRSNLGEAPAQPLAGHAMPRWHKSPWPAAHTCPPLPPPRLSPSPTLRATRETQLALAAALIATNKNRGRDECLKLLDEARARRTPHAARRTPHPPLPDPDDIAPDPSPHRVAPKP